MSNDKIFSSLYDQLMRFLEEPHLRVRRGRLLTGLRGRVLEIGVGTGVNFQYYATDVDVIGIEPSPNMMVHALEKQRRSGIAQQIALHEMGWEDEALEAMIAPGSLDHIVCTLVMCTIPEPERALHRFQGWLKPGGQLILLEHIRARRRWLGRVQDWLTPAWSKVAGGCQLNRPTDEWVKAHGFDLLREERFRLGLPFYEAVFVKR